MFRLHKNEFINLCCACCTLILGTPFDLTEPDFIDFFIIHFHFATCDSLVFIMFITAQIFFFPKLYVLMMLKLLLLKIHHGKVNYNFLK